MPEDSLLIDSGISSLTGNASRSNSEISIPSISGKHLTSSFKQMDSGLMNDELNYLMEDSRNTLATS